MTQETNSADINDETGSSENNQVKTYTQKELDDMMARTKSAVARKYEKQLEDLGDINELRKLKTEHEKRVQEEQMKRGEFEKTLQELSAKKDAEIAKRDKKLAEYKIHTPLLTAASTHRAVNADQVKALLSPYLRLDEEGEVEVVKSDGTVRYNDSGVKLSVDDLVKEFLSQNTHFVAAGPTTGNSKSNIDAPQKQELDLTKLDFNDPKDREKYKKYRKSQK